MQKSTIREYIDNTVKELLREKKKVNESAEKKKKLYKPIKENIHEIKKNYKLLREYIECEGEGEYNGDEMLDNEISEIDSNTPQIDKFIENIKSEALDAMTQLSKNGESNSETFETLKKVFDVCYSTQKKKEVKRDSE
jgi:hypothetical protein